MTGSGGVGSYTFSLRRFDSETQPRGHLIWKEAHRDNIELQARHLGTHDVTQY